MQLNGEKSWLAVGAHRWGVLIESHPTITVARYVHASRPTGYQIWDELVWPLSVDVLTETAMLGEIYQASLDFLSVRK